MRRVPELSLVRFLKGRSGSGAGWPPENFPLLRLDTPATTKDAARVCLTAFLASGNSFRAFGPEHDPNFKKMSTLKHSL
jgi:hypothetical protein